MYKPYCIIFDKIRVQEDIYIKLPFHLDGKASNCRTFFVRESTLKGSTVQQHCFLVIEKGFECYANKLTRESEWSIIPSLIDDALTYIADTNGWKCIKCPDVDNFFKFKLEKSSLEHIVPIWIKPFQYIRAWLYIRYCKCFDEKLKNYIRLINKLEDRYGAQIK